MLGIWGGRGFLTSLCGGWAVGVGRGAGMGVGGGCGGQNRPNDAEPGSVGGGLWVSMFPRSEKRKARKPYHLKSSGGWGKDLVAPVGGRPTTPKKPERSWDIPLHLQRWPQGGGRGTRERSWGWGAGSGLPSSALHSSCGGCGPSFCQVWGALRGDTGRLSAGVRWRAGADISEHPTVSERVFLCGVP